MQVTWTELFRCAHDIAALRSNVSYSEHEMEGVMR